MGSNQPYLLVDVIFTTAKAKNRAVIVLESCSRRVHVGHIKSPVVEEVSQMKMYSKYFDDSEANLYFCVSFQDFCMLFDEVVYTTYSLSKKQNFMSCTREKPLNSFMFSENFLSFESYMNDVVTISVFQDHILYEKSKHKPAKEGEPDASSKEF